MDLNNISNKYKENLERFFCTKDVIEIIYRKQYGDKFFEENEDKCLNDFKEILKNTVFIPYITMEHLEDFILSVLRTQGNQFVAQNYNNELNLLRNLHNKKKNIIKKYSSFMLDELKQFYPELTQNEYNEILIKCSNSSFEENLLQIQHLLPQNKNHFFQKKIKKCIEKYKKIVDDKITMETSSYFKHICDIPNEKYYTSILEGMQQGGPIVSSQIGKISDKNIRYIFLPVLTYKNKDDYLKNVLHEVMHISKARIINNKYISGLLESTISKNPNESELSSYASSEDIAIEEITHHWQVREALSEIIKNNNLFDLLQMPYNLNDISPLSNLELFDAQTKPFMKIFNTDIQKVNNGKLSAKKFKKNIGKSNYNTFSQEANMYTNGTSNISEATILDSLITSENYDLSINQNAPSIVDSNLIIEMIHHSIIENQKAEKRANILKKTRSVLYFDIVKIGEYIENRAKSQQDNQSQSIHYAETR